MPDLPLGVQPEPVIPEPAPPDPDPRAPKDPQRRLLDDLKKSKEKYRALELAAVAAGVDPADPAGFIAKREAAAKAKADREIRVRDAVKDHLIESGHKLDKKLVTAIVSGAIADSTVTLDETGNPCGVAVYADAWLSSLNSGGPNSRATAPAPRRVAPPLPVSGSAANYREAKPKGPATFTELTNQGPAAVKAFQEQNPDGYAELREAHIQALRNPTRTQPPR